MRKHGIRTPRVQTQHANGKYPGLRHVSICSALNRLLEQKYSEKCVLGYSPMQVYNVVADVGRYPAFLPWCNAATIHETNERRMTADLQVGFLFLREAYSSEVLLNYPNRINAQLNGKSTILKGLTCDWGFREPPLDLLPHQYHRHRACPDTSSSAQLTQRTEAKGQRDQLAKKASLVTFDVSFQFSNPIHSNLSKLFLSQVVQKMTKSFEGRCETLYGPAACEKILLSS